MRKLALLLTATAAGSLMTVLGAQAADLPKQTYKAPAMVAPLPFSWNGFYIGANIGAGWAGADIDASTGASLGTGTNAKFIGGGQMGYNWQFAPNWVLGIEGTIDGIVSGEKTTPNLGIGLATIYGKANATWTATVAGRLGYTFDRWMIYGKGGGGWVGYDATAYCIAGPCNGLSVSTSSSQGGWLAGAGVEWAFDRNWTAKIEYNYLGLDGQTLGTLNGVTYGLHNPNVQTFTVGVNYLFH